LSAKNSQKLCSLNSQLAKAAKKRTSKKHMVEETRILKTSAFALLLNYFDS